MDIHGTKEKPTPASTMGIDQPNTIVINGVEIPSWYFVWRKLCKYQRSIDRMKAFSLIQFVLILALLLEKLWR